MVQRQGSFWLRVVARVSSSMLSHFSLVDGSLTGLQGGQLVLLLIELGFGIDRRQFLLLFFRGRPRFYFHIRTLKKQ